MVGTRSSSCRTRSNPRSSHHGSGQQVAQRKVAQQKHKAQLKGQGGEINSVSPGLTSAIDSKNRSDSTDAHGLLVKSPVDAIDCNPMLVKDQWRDHCFSTNDTIVQYIALQMVQ